MERFFDKVCKTASCWNWTASKRAGYGAFKFEGKVIGAHVFSYRYFKGHINSGLDVCHKCDNRACVNPDHLFLGSRSDNMQDAKRKGRLAVPVWTGIRKHPSCSAYMRGCRCDECRR